MKPAKRRQLYEKLARANPNPATELRFSTPFELLVAVVLSAQATDLSVNQATAKLFKVANTPQAILDLVRSARPGSCKIRGARATRDRPLRLD